MSNVAIVFGVIGKFLGLLPDAVALQRTCHLFIKNQNQSKITTRPNQNKAISSRLS
jgi:hypothetical protein